MGEIIVGVDGSDHSRRALIWAMREAALRHDPLMVMSVRQVPVEPVAGVYWPLFYAPDTDHDVTAAQDALQELVDKVASDIGRTVPEIIVTVTQGDPAAELLRQAQDCDLLVLGTRGSGGFARLLMGSVSTKVVHHATCPVVVIPPEET